MAEEKKVTAKVIAPVKAEGKEVKEEAKKAPAKKAAPAKKTVAKKAETKTTAKATATKAAADKKEAAPKAAKKAAEVQASVVVEFSGKACTPDSLIASAKDVWQYDMGNDVADIKKLEIYLKPEESTAYFVVNGEATGNFFI